MAILAILSLFTSHLSYALLRPLSCELTAQTLPTPPTTSVAPYSLSTTSSFSLSPRKAAASCGRLQRLRCLASWAAPGRRTMGSRVDRLATVRAQVIDAVEDPGLVGIEDG